MSLPRTQNRARLVYLMPTHTKWKPNEACLSRLRLVALWNYLSLSTSHHHEYDKPFFTPERANRALFISFSLWTRSTRAYWNQRKPQPSGKNSVAQLNKAKHEQNIGLQYNLRADYKQYEYHQCAVHPNLTSDEQSANVLVKVCICMKVSQRHVCRAVSMNKKGNSSNFLSHIGSSGFTNTTLLARNHTPSLLDTPEQCAGRAFHPQVDK